MNEYQIEKTAGFHFASLFFYRLFHQSPDQQWIDSLKADALFEQWPLELPAEQQTILRRVSLSLEADTSDISQQLSQDFADLFVGPNQLLAAPWASVYLTAEQLNCGLPTLQVKACYEKFGLTIDTGEVEPEDHIGLMFAFLAYLTQQGLEAVGHDQSADVWVSGCKHFLEAHLLTWAPRFLELVEQHANTDFYVSCSQLCRVMLEQLAAFYGADVKPARLFR